MEGSSSDEDYLSAEDELGGKGDAIDKSVLLRQFGGYSISK